MYYNENPNNWTYCEKCKTLLETIKYNELYDENEFWCSKCNHTQYKKVKHGEPKHS